MPNTNDHCPSPRSVVLVDWSRYNEPSAPDPNSLLYELMFLSLLYDEVLIQDEILVTSKKLAGWFNTTERFRLLEELFATGAIKVLKRPLRKYPEHLQEEALKSPIRARAKHLIDFSVTNTGQFVQFKDSQLQFHDRLEACLRGAAASHREAGRRALRKDIMSSFGIRLTEVLTDGRYEKWRDFNFPHIEAAAAEDFVKFARDPGLAIGRLKKLSKEAKYTPEGDSPIFNTALAIQVAATYGPAATSIVDLIETVFSEQFCLDEAAVGRHGPDLRELPLLLEDDCPELAERGTVAVQTQVQVPVGLPLPQPGYSEIILRVRESRSGTNLRNVMGRLGSDRHFNPQLNAWREVGDHLASMIGEQSQKRVFDIWSVVASIGRGTFYGALVELAANPGFGRIMEVERLGLPLLSAGCSVAGDYLSTLSSIDLRRQEISEKLERAVAFRCVDYPRLTSNPLCDTKKAKIQED